MAEMPWQAEWNESGVSDFQRGADASPFKVIEPGGAGDIDPVTSRKVYIEDALGKTGLERVHGVRDTRLTVRNSATRKTVLSDLKKSGGSIFVFHGHGAAGEEPREAVLFDADSKKITTADFVAALDRNDLPSVILLSGCNSYGFVDPIGEVGVKVVIGINAEVGKAGTADATQTLLSLLVLGFAINDAIGLGNKIIPSAMLKTGIPVQDKEGNVVDKGYVARLAPTVDGTRSLDDNGL